MLSPNTLAFLGPLDHSFPRIGLSATRSTATTVSIVSQNKQAASPAPFTANGGQSVSGPGALGSASWFSSAAYASPTTDAGINIDDTTPSFQCIQGCDLNGCHRFAHPHLRPAWTSPAGRLGCIWRAEPWWLSRAGSQSNGRGRACPMKGITTVLLPVTAH